MRLLFRRPVILVIMAVIMLLYSIFEYNLLLPLLFSFSAIGTGNFFESAMSLIQLIYGVLTSSGMLSMAMVYFLAAIAVVALAAGALFGGLFNIINNILEKKSKLQGEFISGVKKYFLRLFAINLRVILLTIIIVVFVMIVCVPAIAATRTAAQTDSGFLTGAVLIDIVTLFVVFFIMLYYRIYILFWYPSAMVYDRKAFSRGKHFVDQYFWRIARRIVGYDLVFLIFGGALLAGKLALMHDQSLNFGVMLAVLVLDWIFKTVFVGMYIVYVFSFFRRHIQHVNEQESE